MNIQGFQKTTLLDYPKHLAATVFFGGCNFRCPFCHNGDLVITPNQVPAYTPDEILSYLEKRKNILEGVCITGGEPTLQSELPGFLDRIKQLGLNVKLDTNGYRPDSLKQLCRAGLVDYVAMDIKGSPAAYASICGLSEIDFFKIEASIDFLRSGCVEYEFRTTITRELHPMNDFYAIGNLIKGTNVYYLQSYRESPQVISPIFSAYTFEELEEIRELLRNDISHVEIRGLDN